MNFYKNKIERLFLSIFICEIKSIYNSQVTYRYNIVISSTVKSNLST